MGTETTSATYRRTQTHESQSFSPELLEYKGTGSKHLSQTEGVLGLRTVEKRGILLEDLIHYNNE